MTVNASTEEFQHVELLGKYALFTNGRIDCSTVPEGWYCYDFRGSDDDPGELRYIEESVAVNHAGSILMPEKLELPASGRLDVRDEFGFLDEGDMTLHEFCEVHDLPYPAEDVGAGDVGGKAEIFAVMELDYFRYFLCYQVDTGDAAGNGRCVNGVGVGDTVEIWFFGGLSVGYRNLAERLKLSCPFQEHFYP